MFFVLIWPSQRVKIYGLLRGRGSSSWAESGWPIPTYGAHLTGVSRLRGGGDLAQPGRCRPAAFCLGITFIQPSKGTFILPFSMPPMLVGSVSPIDILGH